MSAFRCRWRVGQLLASVVAAGGLLFSSDRATAGDFDVDQITIAKTATWLQIGPNNFLVQPIMLEAHAEVLPWQGGLISGRFAPPGSDYIDLLPDERGALYFDASFDTIAEWHAGVPDGTYWFDLKHHDR